MSADTLKAQIVADDFQLLLDGSLGQREHQFISPDAVPQAVIFNILLDYQRHSKDTTFPCLLLHDFKAVSIAIFNDIA